MAQANTDAALRLRLAILTIAFPRGIRDVYDFLKKLDDNLKLGGDICNMRSKMVQEHFFLTINTYFDNEPPFQLEDGVLSGSFSEGTPKFNYKEEKISDIDFMLVLKNIKVTEADQEKGNLPVKENTPFVNLYLSDEDLLKTWSDFLEISNKPRYEKAKLSSRKLKERFRENYIKNVPFALSINDEDVELVDDGPSIAVRSSTPFTEESKDMKSIFKKLPKTDYDFVLAIKCHGWPLCAQEWLFRTRCWPSQDLVQTIVKDGFHIVCKSSPEGDFRLSYSNAETLLITNLSDLQFKTYRAFKSFVSHYKKNWGLNAKKAVCSYHLKTIVLWYSEKSDPIDWTEDTIVGHLLSLIDDLVLALNEKNLPMYFMPKYNLMERLEDTIEALKQITELRLNLSLITKAVISEEPNYLDGFDILWNFYSEESFQPYLSGIDDINLTTSGFRDSFEKSIKILDKFWESATGKIPDREDLQARARIEQRLPLVEETFKRLFKEYSNASFQRNFDQMGTCYATLNSHFKDRDEWHEWLFSMYNQRRNADEGNTPSISVNDHH